MHALVERGGEVSASHVPDVTAKTLGAALEKAADRRSTLNTDDSLANLSIGKDFAEHRTVAHTLGEYVSKDGEAHTQTVESLLRHHQARHHRLVPQRQRAAFARYV